MSDRLNRYRAELDEIVRQSAITKSKSPYDIAHDVLNAPINKPIIPQSEHTNWWENIPGMGKNFDWTKIPSILNPITNLFNTDLGQKTIDYATRPGQAVWGTF